MATKKKTPGVGLDIGTMNIVAARRGGEGIEYRRMRDAFLVIPKAQGRLTRLADTSYVERGDDLIILGDNALVMANAFGSDPRRPLAGGLISPRESDALSVLKLLIQSVLGDPTESNEACYFSVPAAPLDQPDRDIIYHQGVFSRVVEECGYEAFPANEAMALVFSECAQDDFSGITFSFGSGMTNVALALKTVEVLSFSVARGGDWIDKSAANATGHTQARICALKENGINLLRHASTEEEALALYYKAMIEHALDQVARQFTLNATNFQFPKPIPLIVSGGTSKAGGFLDFFQKVWEKKRRKFPIEVSEVRAAKDPLNAVAHGMLVQARQEYED